MKIELTERLAIKNMREIIKDFSFFVIYKYKKLTITYELDSYCDVLMFYKKNKYLFSNSALIMRFASFIFPSGVTVPGWTPYVLDWWWSTGTRQNWFNNYGIHTYWSDTVSGYVIGVRLLNAHTSSAASGTLVVRILWLKTSHM